MKMSGIYVARKRIQVFHRNILIIEHSCVYFELKIYSIRVGHYIALAKTKTIRISHMNENK